MAYQYCGQLDGGLLPLAKADEFETFTTLEQAREYLQDAYELVGRQTQRPLVLKLYALAGTGSFENPDVVYTLTAKGIVTEQEASHE